MIGNGSAQIRGSLSLLGGAAGGNVASSDGARSDAATGDGASYADYAANLTAPQESATSTPARNAPGTGDVVPPSTAVTTFPMQNLTSLKQQGADVAAVAAAAASQAASLAANAAKLVAATATVATTAAANQADLAQTVAGDARPTDALAMLAAMNPQDGSQAAAAAKPATATTAATKTRDSDSASDAIPTAPADASLSQQMLALLAGSLAITAPAQPAQNAVTLPVTTDATATGAGNGTAAALMASNAATQLKQSPGLAQSGALAALLDPKAASTDAPADALKLALNVSLDGDAGSGFAVPTDNDDKPTPFGLSSAGATAPTLDRTLTSNAVAATPLAMPAHLDDGFDDGLGTRIAWMAEQKLGHAEIRLNPENAGPIEVRIQLDGTQVNASFNSANAEVRQALEASLPRLREMLGQQGMQLGNTDIGQRQGQQQSQQGQSNARGFTATTDDSGTSASASASSTAPIIVRSRGLLDEYA